MSSVETAWFLALKHMADRDLSVVTPIYTIPGGIQMGLISRPPQIPLLEDCYQGGEKAEPLSIKTRNPAFIYPVKSIQTKAQCVKHAVHIWDTLPTPINRDPRPNY